MADMDNRSLSGFFSFELNCLRHVTLFSGQFIILTEI